MEFGFSAQGSRLWFSRASRIRESAAARKSANTTLSAALVTLSCIWLLLNPSLPIVHLLLRCIDFVDAAICYYEQSSVVVVFVDVAIYLRLHSVNRSKVCTWPRPRAS